MISVVDTPISGGGVAPPPPATQFIYTFENDTVDAFPAGFYESAGSPAYANWQVKAAAGTMGGKALQFDGGLGSGLNTYLSISELDTKDTNFVEVLGRVKVLNLPSAAGGYELAALVPKYKENGDHYRFSLWHDPSGPLYRVVARKVVAGNLTQMTNDSIPWTINEWLMLRVRQTSTNIHYRFWKSNVAEPSSWTKTIAEAEITGLGKVGATVRRGNAAVQVDWISVGIQGATALMA